MSDSEQRRQTNIESAELRLQKEIEQVRAELRETELRLQKEISHRLIASGTPLKSPTN